MLINIFLRSKAYLDPGSGSFVIQMLLAGLLGILVAIRVYWKNIVSFLKKNKDAKILDELDEIDEKKGDPDWQRSETNNFDSDFRHE